MQTRMNGGTNIALAIQRAGQLLKAADAAAAEASALQPSDIFAAEHAVSGMNATWGEVGRGGGFFTLTRTNVQYALCFAGIG